MKITNKRYPLNQCALYKCRSQKRLERLLNMDEGALKQVRDLIKYSQFQIDKKGTTDKRDITAPCYDLKKIQSRILALLRPIERPQWLISGERGKSYVDNGRAHLTSKYLLAMDIKSFYDNCTREAAYQFFSRRLATSPDVAKVLTDIVTYNAGIPTGCPTSQIIAYYAYEEMFTLIAQVAERYSCIFTLYVDDMTFSSNIPFEPTRLTREIDIVLRKYGHRPKYKKVKYYPENSVKHITGTAITPDHQLVVPNALQHKIYVDFQSMKQFASQDKLSPDQRKELNRLNGRIQAAKSIAPDIFPEITRQVKQMSHKRNTLG